MALNKSSKETINTLQQRSIMHGDGLRDGIDLEIFGGPGYGGMVINDNMIAKGLRSLTNN